MQSINPANNVVIWEGEVSSTEDVNAAAARARTALQTWKKTPLEARIALVERFKDILASRKEEMAEAIAKETGKVLWDARGEVGAMVGKVAISIEAYHERTGERERDVVGAKLMLRHKPHGVMAIFGPYNFPGHLPNGHIIPALIAGNTMVFKPSDYTPMVGELLVSFWQEAGLPDGVLNLVQGGKDTGVALANAEIDGLLFTGSSSTGKILHKQFCGRPEVLLALEMGGNNPLIVWEPEEVKAAAYNIIQSAYITSGQRCTCARRLIIPEGAEGDAVIEATVEMIKGISVGAYDEEPAAFMGSLIGMREAERLIDKQQALADSGASVLQPMEWLREGLPYLSPGLIDVTNVVDCGDEEFFGPMLQVIRVADFEAAIEEANNTQYGLAAALLSKDEKLWQQFQQEIHAGIVNWNKPTAGAASSMPFGGVGCSGNHRASAFYAADYCAYPMASMEAESLAMPEQFPPGLAIR